MVYFNDILTYSRDHDEHVKDLREVLNVPRQEFFFGNHRKCQFYQDRIIFLEHVISQNKVEVEEKVEQLGSGLSLSMLWRCGVFIC